MGSRLQGRGWGQSICRLLTEGLDTLRQRRVVHVEVRPCTAQCTSMGMGMGMSTDMGMGMCMCMHVHVHVHACACMCMCMGMCMCMCMMCMCIPSSSKAIPMAIEWKRQSPVPCTCRWRVARPLWGLAWAERLSHGCVGSSLSFSGCAQPTAAVGAKAPLCSAERSAPQTAPVWPAHQTTCVLPREGAGRAFLRPTHLLDTERR